MVPRWVTSWKGTKVWKDSFGSPGGELAFLELANVLPKGLKSQYLSVYRAELILSCFLNSSWCSPSWKRTKECQILCECMNQKNVRVLMQSSSCKDNFGSCPWHSPSSQAAITPCPTLPRMGTGLTVVWEGSFWVPRFFWTPLALSDFHCRVASKLFFWQRSCRIRLKIIWGAGSLPGIEQTMYCLKLVPNS